MSIEFKLTRDPILLNQYYTLREQCFQQELGLPDFDGSEDEHDRQGHILLAIQNGQCIGGARISSNVVLQSQLKQLELDQKACCMWERLVFNPAARTLELMRKFLAYLILKSREIGYSHAMVLSSLRNARFYRQCHSALSVGFNIYREVPHSASSAFAGLEHYLSVANLQDADRICVAYEDSRESIPSRQKLRSSQAPVYRPLR